MSNVYKRLRNETEMQFYINALNLQVEITKFVMKEKILPKKWRFAIGYNLISKVDELVDNITFANSIFAQNEVDFKKRQDYQTLAITNCYQIHNKLTRMEKCVESVTIKKLDTIIELLNETLKALKGWKAKDKIKVVC